MTRNRDLGDLIPEGGTMTGPLVVPGAAAAAPNLGSVENTAEFHDPASDASWRISGTTLECWGTDTSGITGQRSINYPAGKVYARAPTVTVSARALVGDPRNANTVNTTATGFTAQVTQPDGTGSSNELLYYAIGEWDGIS